jgi:transposase-like protein
MDINDKTTWFNGCFYSEAFKRHVVAEIDSGSLTPGEARRKYGIRGHHTLHDWIRRYSKFATSILRRQPMSPLEPAPQPDRSRSSESRVRDLERELADALVHIRALNTMITLAEETYQIEIRKNSGAKRSSNSTLKQDPQA